MQRNLFGLSLGFAALILLTAHAGQRGGPGLSFLSPLPKASVATLPEAPR